MYIWGKKNIKLLLGNAGNNEEIIANLITIVQNYIIPLAKSQIVKIFFNI
jgi:hypothetical protein